MVVSALVAASDVPIATSWYSILLGESSELADLGGLDSVGDGFPSLDALLLDDSFGHRGISFRFAVDSGRLFESPVRESPLEPGRVLDSGLEPDPGALMSFPWLLADAEREPSSDGLETSGADLASVGLRPGERPRVGIRSPNLDAALAAPGSLPT